MERIFKILVHTGGFVLVMIFFRGVTSENDLGLLMIAFLYGFAMMLLPDVLKFFKFPDNFWARILLGTILTIGVFFLLQTVLSDVGVFRFVPGEIGLLNSSIPTFEVTTESTALLISAVIVNIYSIIMEKLSGS